MGVVKLTTVEEIGKASGGWAVEHEDGSIYVPVVMMDEQGKGHGGRFLDALPTDRTIKFPNVISDVLAGMLERRGFTVIHGWADEFDEWCPVYIRRPPPTYAREAS